MAFRAPQSIDEQPVQVSVRPTLTVVVTPRSFAAPDPRAGPPSLRLARAAMEDAAKALAAVHASAV